MADYKTRLEDAIIQAHEAGDEEAAQFLANELKQWQPKNVVGSESIKQVDSIPRQLGLTGRYIAEGLADTAGIVSDPLSALSNKLLGTNLQPLGQATSSLLDKAGLPKPETPQERVVAIPSRLLAGTGGLMGGARALSNSAGSALDGVLNSLTVRPDLQASSAIGSGYFGGVAKENEQGVGAQIGASLLGGVLAPLSVSGAQNLTNTVKNVLSPRDITGQIDNILARSNVTMEGAGVQATQALKKDIANALKQGGDLSTDAVARLADYRGIGATPMRSNLTLNPADITIDKNLAKLSANMTDPSAQGLALLQNENNKKLINSLNQLGANTSDDTYLAGQKIIGALDQRNAKAKDIISEYYDMARNSQGRSANLDPSAFTQKANDLLDDALLGGKLPSDVRNLLNKTAKGEMPLTVDVAEQFKTRIGDLQRSTNDMAERKALGLVRQALDDAPLLDNVGEDAMKAFNRARRVNRAYMNIVDKTPALKAVRDGIEPDKFVDQFIISNNSKSSVMDVAMLKNNLKGNKEAQDAVKGQILAYLKKQATNNPDDALANFSPSGFNKGLDKIGDRKLKLFFDDGEIEQLKRIGRVASYEKAQPVGSAVNNSNTASAALSKMLDLTKFIPLGGALIKDPVQNIQFSLNKSRTLNAPKSLLMQQAKKPLPVPLFPMMGVQGLISE